MIMGSRRLAEMRGVHVVALHPVRRRHRQVSYRGLAAHLYVYQVGLQQLDIAKYDFQLTRSAGVYSLIVNGI